MKKLIWYVDRDEQISKIVERELPRVLRGYDVLVLNNPLVIDAKLEERLPDIIFIDAAMAEQDNAIILKDLRMKKGVEKIPFVVMAIDVRIEDRAKALGTFALGKPFGMNEIAEKVREILEKKPEEKKVKEVEKVLEEVAKEDAEVVSKK